MFNNSTSDHIPRSVADISTSYHGFGPATYLLSTTYIKNPDQSPRAADLVYDGPVTKLAPNRRLEAISAITRAPSGVPIIQDSNYHLSSNQDFVSYQGSMFSLSISVADMFREPPWGPRYDPDWRDPVRVDATVEGQDFTVSMTNELETELPVHHFGRPYFGVLTAVSGEPQLLPHERYDENQYIETNPLVRHVTPSDQFTSIERLSESLQPGGTLAETYRLPTDIPNRSRVFFSLPIGDSSVDLLDKPGYTPRVHATITLESTGSRTTSN